MRFDVSPEGAPFNVSLRLIALKVLFERDAKIKLHPKV